MIKTALIQLFYF